MEMMEETVYKAHTGEGAQIGCAQRSSPPPSTSSTPNGSFQGSTEMQLSTDPIIDKDNDNYTQVTSCPRFPYVHRPQII